MGSYRSSKQMVLAEIESVYGTDPTPVAADDAILTGIVTYELLTENIDRANIASGNTD